MNVARKLWVAFTAVAVCLGMAPLVLADDQAVERYTLEVQGIENTEPIVYLQATMGAHVVSNQGDKLVVYLKNPEGLKEQESDESKPLIELPLVERTAAVDAQGKELALGDVLPGQEVRVSFRFSWYRGGGAGAASFHECTRIELRGDVLQRKSTARVDDFGRDVLVGTVLEKTGNQLLMYVESGQVFYGDTEYLHRGTVQVAVPTDAVITNSSGAAQLWSDIQPFQRVALTVGEAVWQESYPPSYVPQTAANIEVMDVGEKIVAPETLENRYRFVATVLSVERDGDNTPYLTVRPEAGYREADLAESYRVTTQAVGKAYAADNTMIGLDQIPAGSRVEIRYEGLIYGEGVGDIPYYSSIQVLP